ncbi:MAG TPA: hypothetical protein VLA56_13965 [Pseudomonadales bacterium]|nr:hypothetical protein [Pseudomonadales bacterium]
MDVRHQFDKQGSVFFPGDLAFGSADVPMIGAAPTENVPEGLRRAFRAASDGRRMYAASVDFSTISAADMDLDRWLHDMQLMSDFATQQAKPFRRLLKRLHDFRATDALLGETGLKHCVRSGDLVTGAAGMARLVSSILEPREHREHEVPLFVGDDDYAPIRPEEGMCSAARETIHLTRTRKLLVTPDLLAIYRPSARITAADFALVVDRLTRHRRAFEEIVLNFQNPARIREIAARIGMSEADVIAAGGGLGCGALVVIVVVVVVVCVCYVFC